MKLSEVKLALSSMDTVSFFLENGNQVPAHFHVTEVGMLSRHFIDCGGTIRFVKTVQFQLWTAYDLEHQLRADKLLKIIKMAENQLELSDEEVEVEYQGETIGVYQLALGTHGFLLKNKTTACLAEDQCGIKPAKPKIQLNDLKPMATSCNPNGGCC